MGFNICMECGQPEEVDKIFAVSFPDADGGDNLKGVYLFEDHAYKRLEELGNPHELLYLPVNKPFTMDTIERKFLP